MFEARHVPEDVKWWSVTIPKRLRVVPGMVKGPSGGCAVLTTDAELQAALAESFDRPLVLLKHSVWCGLSERAIDAARGEIEMWTEQIGCRLVVVQDHRDLSDAIAQRLGIRHETPQIVVIRNGRAVWHASHARITDQAVRRELEASVAQARVVVASEN